MPDALSLATDGMFHLVDKKETPVENIEFETTVMNLETQ